MIKKIVIITLLIALTGMSFIILFHDSNVISYIEEVNIQVGDKTYHLLKYDFGKYIINLKNTILTPTELRIKPIPLQWTDPGNDITQKQFWEGILNNIKWIGDLFILFANIMLYPIRVSSYVGRVLLAVLGFNFETENNLSWLYYLIEVFGVQFPYIGEPWNFA